MNGQTDYLIAKLGHFRDHQSRLKNSVGAMKALAFDYPWGGDFPHTAEDMRRIGRELRSLAETMDTIAVIIAEEPAKRAEAEARVQAVMGRAA